MILIPRDINTVYVDEMWYQWNRGRIENNSFNNTHSDCGLIIAADMIDDVFRKPNDVFLEQ